MNNLEKILKQKVVRTLRKKHRRLRFYPEEAKNRRI